MCKNPAIGRVISCKKATSFGGFEKLNMMIEILAKLQSVSSGFCFKSPNIGDADLHKVIVNGTKCIKKSVLRQKFLALAIVEISPTKENALWHDS
jgi:hypothetical protein